MKIRNRMADVVKLRCNACQDFMKMAIEPGWQQKLYKIAKGAVENRRFADNYIAVYEKMRDIGIDNYQVTDMDVSFIVQVVRFCDDVVSVKGATKDAIRKLKEDRNLTTHSNENEEDEDLYLRGLLALCDLRNFIRVVDKVEVSISDEERLNFRNKYLPMVEELQDVLDEERIQIVQIRKERTRYIKSVLESEEPDKMWLEIVDLYYKRNLHADIECDEYISFFIEAAEAGVVQAYSRVATYYYYKEDFDRAEYYLNLLYADKGKNHDIKGMMMLADIYINRLSTKHGDGIKIIEELISAGINIVKTEDGKRYEWLSRSIATKGKCLFSIPCE